MLNKHTLEYFLEIELFFNIKIVFRYYEMQFYY